MTLREGGMVFEEFDLREDTLVVFFGCCFLFTTLTFSVLGWKVGKSQRAREKAASNIECSSFNS